MFRCKSIDVIHISCIRCNYAAQIVQPVAVRAVVMFRSVTITTQELKVLEVKRDARVIDVVLIDVALVVDDDAGPVQPTRKAALTQAAHTPGISIAAFRPGTR